MTNAADERSDVLGLVYTAAFVPHEGESIVALGVGFTPPEALGHLVFTGEPFASPAFIDPAFFPQFFAQDLSPKKAAALNEGQQPVDLATFFTPSGPVASLPSWYAVSGEDLMIDPAQQRFMAQRIGATMVEFDEASHAGGYTHFATRFAKLIDTAAEATAGPRNNQVSPLPAEEGNTLPRSVERRRPAARWERATKAASPSRHTPSRLRCRDAAGRSRWSTVGGTKRMAPNPAACRRLAPSCPCC